MGGINWSACPRCWRLLNDTRRLAARLASEGYGKVSEEEYLRLIKESLKTPTLEATLRCECVAHVDREGAFTFNYTAACHKCGYRFEHRHVQQTLPEEPLPNDDQLPGGNSPPAAPS